MSQFTAFCDSAARAEHTEQATTLHNIAVGAQGTGDAIKKALDTLVKQANGGS